LEVNQQNLFLTVILCLIKSSTRYGIELFAPVNKQKKRFTKHHDLRNYYIKQKTSKS